MIRFERNGQHYTIVGSFQYHTYLNHVRIAFSLPEHGPTIERWKPCDSLDAVAFAADSAVYEVLDGEFDEFGNCKRS